MTGSTKPQRFRTRLLPTMKTATYIEIPDRVARALGNDSRLKVRGSVNDAPFRSSYVKMGGERLMAVNRSTREASGAQAGDMVTIVMERDDAPRTVTPPKELAAGMKKDAKAAAMWKRLSYTNQRLYAEWIDSAKRPETRAARIEKALKLLADGKPLR